MDSAFGICTRSLQVFIKILFHKWILTGFPIIATVLNILQIFFAREHLYNWTTTCILHILGSKYCTCPLALLIQYLYHVYDNQVV